MPKNLLVSNTISFPEDVTVEVKSRNVRVKGPRGELTRNFKHLDVDFKRLENGRKLKVDMWHGSTKRSAAIRTVSSHILNMVTGVRKGYQYKMRFVYAHFPVNVAITDDAGQIEIRNFLGEKVTRIIKMHPGVTISRSTKVKDEVVLEGNDIEKVSNSAARIQQSCKVKNKDIRKFLDGIYVSEKIVMGEDDE